MKEVDYSKYLGEWVLSCGDKVVAHSKDLRDVAKHIDTCKSVPTLMKVPSGETLYL